MKTAKEKKNYTQKVMIIKKSTVNLKNIPKIYEKLLKISVMALLLLLFICLYLYSVRYTLSKNIYVHM